MECCGSVSFQATYRGQKTDVLALVTPALQDEILLSWRTLQRLDVIPDDFPNGACVAKAIPIPSAPKSLSESSAPNSPAESSPTESSRNKMPADPRIGVETSSL